jgi:uncharacterized membrane protein
MESMMSKNRWYIRSALLGLVLLVLFAVAAVAGDTFYIQRNKVEVKAGRGAFYPTVYVAKLGEAFEILETVEGWYKIHTPKGDGWVFEGSVAAKKPGKSFASFMGTTDSSELDKTAGFKGFDAPTEKAYVSKNNLQAQMKLVDRIQQPAFTIRELEVFQKNGQVGPLGR